MDDAPHCWNDHLHGPAVGERIHGMADDHEIVELLCYACLHTD